MKKEIYKIVKRPLPQTFNREKAVELFRQFTKGKKALGAYVRTFKALKLQAGSGDAAYSINELKQRYLAEVGRVGSSSYLHRTYFGKVISVPLGTDGYSYAEALNQIKRKIRTHREGLKRNGDRLKSRGVGYYLKQYQDKALKNPKRPTSDAEFTGIEIECIMPENVDLAPLLPFAKWVNVGSDGSIQHESGEDGYELRVCIEKTEVRNVLPGLMAALKQLGARVNRSCGLHVHLDQRRATMPSQSFHKLVRAQGLLFTVVPKSRRKNTYCGRNRHADFETARNSGDRYKAINATSFDKYQTIEVRLFGGTLEAEKIINWVETLWAIVNGEMVLRCPTNFDNAARHWKLSAENIAWLKARQIKFAELNALAPFAESETEENQALLEERAQARAESSRCEHCDTNTHSADDCECDCGDCEESRAA